MNLLTTPLGRKNIEAASGALLLLFMIEHFAANLLLLLNDPAPYRWYTETMGRSLLVRGLEVGLFALFVVHIAIGLWMRAHHRRLLRKNPRLPRPGTFATKYVGFTGVVILIFLVVHLLRFFVPNRLQSIPGHDLYTEARVAFSSAWYTAFYVFAMMALALHLKHGVRSALFSFKILPPRYVPRMRVLLSWTGFIVSAGLAYIAVHLFIAASMSRL